MKKNLLCFLIFLFLFHIPGCNFVNAQTFLVEGKVISSAASVENALVTFENKNDSSKKFSTTTDSQGNYGIGITVTSVQDDINLPGKFNLEQNYPNPFSSSTAIPYELKVQSDIQVTIYDILGRVVRKFTSVVQAAGLHSVLWDGKNNFGEKSAAGIYFYRLQAGDESRVKKMVYNTGESFALPGAYSLQMPKISSEKAVVQVNEFKIYIENTGSTLPQIISKQVDNVIIQNDTIINFTVEFLSNIPVATIYLDSVQQYIRGFGGANILRWRPDMTVDQVNKAFGTGSGQIGFSILRLRVPYVSTNEEFGYNLPTAKLAQSLGAIVFASPWTPPPAMKTNNNIVGGSLKESSYTEYAAHLKSFADYMANNGVPLYAISVQNEPDITVTYESCDWDPAQMLKFVKENGESVGTRLIAPESFQFRRPISDALLNDSAACANLDIVGGHIYGGGLAPYPLAVSKGKEIWMTEHLELDTTWAGVLGTGREMHNCLNAGMNAYITWYTVRFYGPVGEDGKVTKRGYVMSQFARFVRPGFHKVKCNPTPQGNIFVTSYKDSTSKIVIIVLNLNTFTVKQTFSIPKGSMSAFSSYTTSQLKNCEQGPDVEAINSSITVTLDPSSITTFESK